MIQSAPVVLIVDDDFALRTAFARALERVGYSVATATGSPEVLDLISEISPSLILLDNHMPETSGIDLIRAIRRQPGNDRLPIVLISGSSVQGEIDQAMAAGATDFRRKPIDLAELIATVDAVHGGRPTRQPAPQGLAT